MLQLYQYWMDSAFSGLFAAVANKKLSEFPKSATKGIEKCSKNAKDVILHARCVSKLLDKKVKNFDSIRQKAKTTPAFVQENQLPSLPSMKLKNRITTKKRVHIIPKQKSLKQQYYFSKSKPKSSIYMRKLLYSKKLENLNRKTKPWRRRIKRSIIQRDKYELKTKYSDLTAIGAVGKLLTQITLVSKNQSQIRSWQFPIEKVQELQQLERQIYPNQKGHKQEFDESLMFRGLYPKNIDKSKLATYSQNFKQIPYMQRLKDDTGEPNSKLMYLFRDGIKLGYALSGKNVSNINDKNIKAFSPRFFSVTSDQDDEKANFLSPSLFSLHDKGTGMEKQLSLPNFVKGFSRHDMNEWMNFVIEASGVHEQVGKLEKDFMSKRTVQPTSNQLMVSKHNNHGFRAKDDQVHYYSKEKVRKMFGSYEERKVKTWEKMIRTYSKEQLAELNKSGYTILNKEQLYIIYGDDSPFNHSATLDRLLKLNTSHIHEGIERDIKQIALARSFKLRLKDVVLSPILFAPSIFAKPLNQPIVLSPVLFSPVIGTPSVLGPVVLSPLVFTPVILSPQVLGPLILSPIAFVPIVLSPFVLHPYILSPALFVPVVLNPFVLSPFILSPAVFTPLILSPLVLNPAILNPTFGSPLILSPFVLTPIIMSPHTLFGIILSPYAASPAILSKNRLTTIFLSPSILS